MFGYLESQLFNTYLAHVIFLGSDASLYISLMVILSAIAGLITHFVFGIFSDNHRSRFGRRRPFLLAGGLIAGFFMIFYAFTGSYLLALIIDVIAVGAGSNLYYVAQRALIPDLVDINYRGRANGVANGMGIAALGISTIVFFIFLNDRFGIPYDGGTIITQQGYIFALSIGGIIFIAIGLMAFLFIREKPGSELPPKKSFAEEFRTIFNKERIRKNKEFYKFVIASTVFYGGTNVVLPFLFVYIFELGFSTLELVAVMGGAGAVALIGSYILGKLSDLHGRKKYLAPAILISCIGFFFIPVLKLFEPVIALYFIVFAFIFTAILGLESILGAFHQDLLPEAARGKYLGIYNITRTFSQVLGVLIGGLAAAAFGYAWAFVFAPIFFIISVPLFLKVKETIQIED